jgi:hypothetical protein
MLCKTNTADYHEEIYQGMHRMYFKGHLLPHLRPNSATVVYKDKNKQINGENTKLTSDLVRIIHQSVKIC